MVFHSGGKRIDLFAWGRKGADKPTGTGAERDEKEYCVLCHGDTGYRKTTPIDQRSYYVEGCGQLCEDCYMETYLVPKSHDKLVGMDRWQS